MSKFNAASALVNSFDVLATLQDTVFEFIILETSDQPLDLDWGFEPEMKENNDPKTEKVIDSMSLYIPTISWSLLAVLKLNPFPRALWGVFFTAFLEFKNFLTSLERLESPQRLLRMMD